MTDEKSNQLNLTVVALVALVAIVGLVALVMNAATGATGQRTVSTTAEGNNLGGLGYSAGAFAACKTCIDGLRAQDDNQVCAENCISMCQSKCNTGGWPNACTQFKSCSGGTSGTVKIKVNTFNGHEDAPMTTVAGSNKGSSALSTDASKSKCFKTTTCANDGDCRDAYLPNAYCSKYARQCVCN